MLALNCQEVTKDQWHSGRHIYTLGKPRLRREPTRCEILPPSSRRSTEWLLWKRRDVIAVLLGRLQFPSHLDFPAREPHNPHVLSHWRWDWRSSPPSYNLPTLIIPNQQHINLPLYQLTIRTYCQIGGGGVVSPFKLHTTPNHQQQHTNSPI